QRVLQGQLVADVPHDHRDELEPSPLRSPPPTLAGDQRVAVPLDLPYEDRLEHTELADRCGEPGQGLLVEVVARLVRVGLDLPDGDLTDAGPRVDVDRQVARDQGTEAL